MIIDNVGKNAGNDLRRHNKIMKTESDQRLGSTNSTKMRCDLWLVGPGPGREFSGERC